MNIKIGSVPTRKSLTSLKNFPGSRKLKVAISDEEKCFVIVLSGDKIIFKEYFVTYTVEK